MMCCPFKCAKCLVIEGKMTNRRAIDSHLSLIDLKRSSIATLRMAKLLIYESQSCSVC